MMEIVAINIIASQPPKQWPTATLNARAKSVCICKKNLQNWKNKIWIRIRIHKDPLESQIGISMDSASKNRSMSSMAAYNVYDYSVAQGVERYITPSMDIDMMYLLF